MKKITFFLLLLTGITYAQIGEGQKFCSGTEDGSYFPLSYEFKKKILWADTFYWETKLGTKNINGMLYTAIKQEWKSNDVAILYLREKNGVIYQYDQLIKKEYIRFDKKFKVNQIWSVDQNTKYKIITYNGELKTPYCHYTNLLVIEAIVNYGHFNFYYLKGQGYIGATKDGKLISCLTPEW
ncbi:hypothetical protein [Flavobacterium denitrificans]|uniref:hypothetical protein n=1 Tax=Flavobacterium denitrificans TaxID=281361 RepID=UPI0004095193|nr:hypothetical protein [Flavobacterium denitrificans]